MNLLLASSGIDFERILPFALFGGFATGAFFLLEMLTARKPRAEERLDVFRQPVSRKKVAEIEKKGDVLGKLLEKATPLASALQPTNEKDAGKLKSALSAAGFRSEGAASIFLGVKFAGLLFGLVLGVSPSARSHWLPGAGCFSGS